MAPSPRIPAPTISSSEMQPGRLPSLPVESWISASTCSIEQPPLRFPAHEFLGRRCQNRGVTLPPGSARENPEACPSGIRHVGGAKLNLALVRNREVCAPGKARTKSVVANGIALFLEISYDDPNNGAVCCSA